jgi:prolipoprotein diacylglyceryl transferase
VLNLAEIPSPSQSVWHLGPIPIRAYALCIVAGILVAIYLAGHRLRARGANEDAIWNIAKWAVPFGIVGGRIYHVATDPELYFLHGNDPVDAFKIWDGGLGIPGAIFFGGLGAWIGCRRIGVRFDSFADAAAPGIVLAQAIGRWGNWFNNELYGRSTDLPWKLQIHCIDVESGYSQICPTTGTNQLGYFQPTFLYESLWDAALAVVLLYVGRRYVLGRGRLFALYMMGYSVGRFWVELLRSDTANHILGLRVNTWTSMIAFVAGLIWFTTRRGPREESIFLDGRPPGDPADDTADADPNDADPNDADPNDADPKDADPKDADPKEADATIEAQRSGHD